MNEVKRKWINEIVTHDFDKRLFHVNQEKSEYIAYKKAILCLHRVYITEIES